MTPQLVASDGAFRCSVCKMPFPIDATSPVEEAFAKHLRTVHQPGQSSEDASQDAKQIVRETNDKP